jgi:hypothetical protein
MLWFDYLNIILILLCVLIVLIRRKIFPLTGKVFLFFFLVIFVQEFLSDIFLVQRKNNLFLYHFFIPIQLIIISWYFVIIIKKSHSFIVGVSIISAMLSLFLSFFYENLSQYFSFASVIKNLIVSILILIYFRKVLVQEVIAREDSNENIWICTGLLINSLGSFFIEGFMNYFMKYDRDFATRLFYLDVTLYFIFYITFIITAAFKRPNDLGTLPK